MNTYTITRYGHTFTIRVDDEIMEAHYRKGELCEYHMLDWIHRNIPRGGVWIDAGANVGNHTLPFSTWAAEVLAFEPMPQNAELLQLNVANFDHQGRVIMFQMGVGAREGFASAKLGGTGQNCQWELIPASGEDCGGSIYLTTIDNECRSRADVRLIKLDVEGMEEAALAGAMETIRRCKPELFIEIWDEPVLERIGALLTPLGYKLIERWNVAPTFHFSASGRYPVTYTPAERLRP
ncbi:MAG: FkbM family methyltransferase [Desulfurellales bacterium]|nr:MAG: FkbM family methyltransferase [Desulfurellales bacterium]